MSTAIEMARHAAFVRDPLRPNDYTLLGFQDMLKRRGIPMTAINGERVAMVRNGSRKAGNNLLDGVEHHHWPVETEVGVER